MTFLIDAPPLWPNNSGMQQSPEQRVVQFGVNDQASGGRNQVWNPATA